DCKREDLRAGRALPADQAQNPTLHAPAGCSALFATSADCGAHACRPWARRYTRQSGAQSRMANALREPVGNCALDLARLQRAGRAGAVLTFLSALYLAIEPATNSVATSTVSRSDLATEPAAFSSAREPTFHPMTF